MKAQEVPSVVQGRPQRAQELPRLTHEPPRSMFGMAKIGTPSRREASFHKNALCHLDRFDHRFRVVLDTILGLPGPACEGPRAAKSGLGTAQERPNAARGQTKTRPRAALVAQEQPKRPRGSSRKVKRTPGEANLFVFYSLIAQRGDGGMREAL